MCIVAYLQCSYIVFCLLVVIQVLESLTESRLMQLGPIPVDLLTKLEAERILTASDCEKLRRCETWKSVVEFVREVIKEDRERKLKFGKLMLHYKEVTGIGIKIIKEEEECK